jgi:hypothetical protein
LDSCLLELAQRVCMRAVEGRKDGGDADLAGQTPSNFLQSEA